MKQLLHRIRQVTAMTVLVMVISAAAAEPLTSSSIRSGQTAPDAAVKFEKRILTDNYYCDGINAGDFNRDGHMDIVAGPFWYRGPDFTQSTAFYPPKELKPEASPSDSMFSYVWDFNKDGWQDILVFGRVHLHQAFWYENPQGRAGDWAKHYVFDRIQGESPPFTDVDGDGKPEIVAHWENQWGLIQPDWNNPTREWTFRPITDHGKWHHFYHGEGVGDVNGDGRFDLLLNEGWYEQPAQRGALWKRNEFRFAEKGGAQMFAYDVDGDHDNDIITALDAHGWGLAWFENREISGKRTFTKHMIMGTRDEEPQYGVAFTQPHALAIADINGDGLTDIITGKRRWAHGPTGDIEPGAAPVNYWFELVRKPGSTAHFVPHLIDANSGLGVQITVTDVTGDRRPDLLASSKLGSFLFANKSTESKKSAAASEMVFPENDWIEATPDSQGLDSSKLNEAIKYLEANAGSDGVHELLIIRNGYLVWKGDRIDHRHGVWSCTKSFTSTVLGLLIQDGKCTLDSKAAEFVPELAKHYPDLTLRHLTTMTSGYRAVGDEPRGTYLHGPSSTPFDPAPHALFTPPGSQYAYWDSAMNLFGLVLTRIAGESLESLFKRRVADPIGMKSSNWDWGDFSKDGDLVVNGGSGNSNKHIFITAREMARFGHLFLNKGSWKGQQLINRDWIENTTRVHVSAATPWAQPESKIDGRGCYGFNWWANGVTATGKRLWPGAPASTFAALGHNNNKLFVIPEWNMAIVRLGLDEGDKKISDEAVSTFLQKIGEAQL